LSKDVNDRNVEREAELNKKKDCFFEHVDNDQFEKVCISQSPYISILTMSRQALSNREKHVRALGQEEAIKAKNFCTSNHVAKSDFKRVGVLHSCRELTLMKPRKILRELADAGQLPIDSGAKVRIISRVEESFL